MSFLQDIFSDRLVAKGFWPPRSPDLTPPDFFLWGFLKSKVYSTLPETLDELEERIREETQKISEETLAKVFKILRCGLRSALMRLVVTLSSINEVNK